MNDSQGYPQQSRGFLIFDKETSDHLPISKLSWDRLAGSECLQLPEVRKHHQNLVGSSGRFECSRHITDPRVCAYD
jgi:hypothetical protein